MACCTLLLKEVVGSLRIGEVFKVLGEYVLQISVNLGFLKKVVLKILLRLLLLGHVKGEMYDPCSEGSLKESFQNGMLCCAGTVFG